MELNCVDSFKTSNVSSGDSTHHHGQTNINDQKIVCSWVYLKVKSQEIAIEKGGRCYE